MIQKRTNYFFIGLDLGQARDYTAISVVERPAGIPFTYRVRGLKRFPLRTSYTDVAEQVKIIVRRPDIQPNLLLVDNTGVGAAVSDLFISMGLHFGADDHHHLGLNLQKRVERSAFPKRDLVSTLTGALSIRPRLKISGKLTGAQDLIEELLNFQVKISISGHDTYGAWREGTHDDLILATAMACWASEMRLLPKGLRHPRPKSNLKRRRMFTKKLSKAAQMVS
jgi:hypothetical protein